MSADFAASGRSPNPGIWAVTSGRAADIPPNVIAATGSLPRAAAVNPPVAALVITLLREPVMPLESSVLPIRFPALWPRRGMAEEMTAALTLPPLSAVFNSTFPTVLAASPDPSPSLAPRNAPAPGNAMVSATPASALGSLTMVLTVLTTGWMIALSSFLPTLFILDSSFLPIFLAVPITASLRLRSNRLLW